MKKTGAIHFRVKGLNQERIINKIVAFTKIYNFNRISHNLSEFEVGYFASKKVKKMLEEEGLEVEILFEHGFLSKCKKVATSYGLIASILLCTLFYAFQYNFILKINVFGVKNAEKSEISEFVEKNIGNRFKKNIDTKDIEFMIKENFDSVSSVSVAIVGQALVININPSVIPDEMKEGDALVSTFDGLITDIDLIQGTLAVKIGDIVKKGDVLVYPYIIDSQGEIRSVVPKANIYADIWLKGEEVHYDYYIKKTKTGRKLTQNYIYLSNILLYSSNRVILFEDYVTEERWTTISKNNILPLRRKSVCYYEIETKEILQEFEGVKDEKISKAKEKALIFLKEGEIIKEENYTIRENCGCYQIEYVITVNRNIGG